MEFKKYNCYNDSTYVSLLLKKKDLEKNKNIYIFVFKDSNLNIIDRKKYSAVEYEKLTEKEKNDLKNASASFFVDSDKKIIQEIKEIEKEIVEYYNSFEKEVKTRFIKDFAEEKNISYEQAKGLLRYVLDEYSLLQDSLKIETCCSDEYFNIEYDFHYCSFEEYFTLKNLDSRFFERIYTHMLNMLKLMNVFKGC